MMNTRPSLRIPRMLFMPLIVLASSLGAGGVEPLRLAGDDWSVPAIPTDAARSPSVTGIIEIRGAGNLTFDPWEIEPLRDDLFAPGHFSVFDVLVDLSARGEITLAYHYDHELQTHVIDNLNGLEGWWYDAHYEGGTFDRTALRMDTFPVKDGMSITLFLEDPERLSAIEHHFRDEVTRLAENKGILIIPEIILRSAAQELAFYDIEVISHDVRPDVFQPGALTALDVLLSLGEMGHLDELGLEFRDAQPDIEVVDGYFVVAISADGFLPEETGACVLTQQISGSIIAEHLKAHTHTTSHIHLTGDLEALVSPESIEWLWVCL